MPLKHFAILGVLALGPCLWADALAKDLSPSAGLSLDQAFAAAIKQSESPAIQVELVAQAEARARQAWTALAPNISAYGSYFLQDPTGLATGSNSQTQTLVKVTGDQPLFRGFRDFAAINQVKSQLAYQQEARQWALLGLWGDTAQALYSTVALQADLAHIDEELTFYDARIKELRQRLAIGRSRPTEVLTVQTARAILAAQREQSLASLKASREVLAFLTGLPADAALADPGDIPASLGSLESLLARLPQRPDLKAAEHQVAASESNVSVVRGGHLPNVDLIGNAYAVRNPSNSYPALPSWDASLVLTLPLFQGGQVVFKTDEALSQLKAAQLAQRQAMRAAEQSIRTQSSNFDADLAQVAALKDAAVLAEKNYRALKSDYDLGLVTNLDVLQALTSYQDTLRSLDKARLQSHADRERLSAAAALPDLH